MFPFHQERRTEPCDVMSSPLMSSHTIAFPTAANFTAHSPVGWIPVRDRLDRVATAAEGSNNCQKELQLGPSPTLGPESSHYRPKTKATCAHCLVRYKGAPLYLIRQCGLIAFTLGLVLGMHLAFPGRVESGSKLFCLKCLPPAHQEGPSQLSTILESQHTQVDNYHPQQHPPRNLPTQQSKAWKQKYEHLKNPVHFSNTGCKSNGPITKINPVVTALVHQEPTIVPAYVNNNLERGRIVPTICRVGPLCHWMILTGSAIFLTSIINTISFSSLGYTLPTTQYSTMMFSLMVYVLLDKENSSNFLDKFEDIVEIFGNNTYNNLDDDSGNSAELGDGVDPVDLVDSDNGSRFKGLTMRILLPMIVKAVADMPILTMKIMIPMIGMAEVNLLDLIILLTTFLNTIQPSTPVYTLLCLYNFFFFSLIPNIFSLSFLLLSFFSLLSHLVSLLFRTPVWKEKPPGLVVDNWNCKLNFSRSDNKQSLSLLFVDDNTRLRAPHPQIHSPASCFPLSSHTPQFLADFHSLQKHPDLTAPLVLFAPAEPSKATLVCPILLQNPLEPPKPKFKLPLISSVLPTLLTKAKNHPLSLTKVLKILSFLCIGPPQLSAWTMPSAAAIAETCSYHRAILHPLLLIQKSCYVRIKILAISSEKSSPNILNQNSDTLRSSF
ncbi:hypothetical protein VP01_1720g1 [Puccinia sorghi]|uniref:Uncharacterized protein n=1 Tax=Puccinia sorghi TaxID=27349 RepID=A0A0L6VFF8_9BASI|nr:hypothetical protein VP01_1720g1 [Puccinia sorghi]